MITGDVPEREYQTRIGSKVITADGHTMGTICTQSADRFTVERGRLLKKHCTIPRTAINIYDPAGAGTVYLTAKRDEVSTD
jgi:hypothetical protein